jgi:hypothetical protein
MGKKTNRYESASKAYEQAMNKYAGEAGWKLALDQAKQFADVSADVARGSGYKAARTAGYGKAASYALANDAANNAVSAGYQSGISNALNNNANALGAYGTNVQNKAGLDQMDYQQGRDTWGMALGTAGEVGKMAAAALSDENLKIIYDDFKIEWL